MKKYVSAGYKKKPEIHEGRWPCVCGKNHSMMMEVCPASDPTLPVPPERQRPTEDSIRHSNITGGNL